jgi:hypothetical protein
MALERDGVIVWENGHRWGAIRATADQRRRLNAIVASGNAELVGFYVAREFATATELHAWIISDLAALGYGPLKRGARSAREK